MSRIKCTPEQRHKAYENLICSVHDERLPQFLYELMKDYGRLKKEMLIGLLEKYGRLEIVLKSKRSIQLFGGSPMLPIRPDNIEGGDLPGAIR